MNSADATYTSRKLAFEADLQQIITANHSDLLFARVSDVTFGVTRIPVVLHIIGNDASYSVNSFMATQVISDLNDLFRKKTGTPGYGLGVDTEIEFCLAIKDANGFPTSGVNIIPDGSHGKYGPYSKTDADDKDIKTPSHWNPDKYLNIWVCDLGNSTEKVWGSDPSMYLHNSDASKKFRDGVVCDMINFNAQFLAHGIGHWLNLRHTYGDDGSTCGSTTGSLINTDYCDDTPWCLGSNNASGSTGFCAPKPQQCVAYNNAPNLERQIENYMDDSQASCMNMFTLKQKQRMQVTLTASSGRQGLSQNSGAVCAAQPTCNDGIKNGTETGIDCGGLSCQACPSCPTTVYFKVNGHSTNWWDIVNVCNVYGSILLNPFNPACHNITYTWWDYTYITFSGMISPAVNGEGQLPEGGFGYLFISIQECDKDRNFIGQESGTWFNISPYKYTSLNLHHFIAYLGNPLAAGKYFRIKLGTSQHYDASAARWVWDEHSAFIKVFEPNVLLSNQTISNSQVGDNISINDCSVNSPINVVASHAIEILPNTSLTDGSYFINTIDCNNISNY